MLVCTSFFFYMCWNVKYSLLMLLSILITYFTGILLDKYSQNQKAKRLLLTFGTLANLFILVYFKYFNFLIDSVNKVFGAEFHFIDVLLPVGISFYTFQAIGYTFDVYFKKINAEKNFINYTLFVSFFPQLVAGPIERSVNMLEQFRTKPRFDISNIKNGGTLILYGLFEKIVVSDRLAIFTEGVFDNYEKMSPLLLILGAVFFSVQIYADFSSYTHIARGSAQLMGYHLMKNFDSPYLAVNIRDFWKRWHISLTSWFTDYLYIPMGGSRVSPLRTYFNIAIVFLVSGLWHGASTTFLVWGALHAVAQIVFRMYDKHIGVKLKYI
ncbi:MAG: MBOAT family O-acyltransferase, partial [Oscillospiraceae bacterium]